MWFGVVSLFPEMFRSVTAYGVTGRAVDNGLLEVELWNPRDFTTDRHRTVDDRPYGGGPGMLMKVKPLAAAIDEAKSYRSSSTGVDPHVVYLSPQGKRFDQGVAKELLDKKSVILIAGRYEGVDERLIKSVVDEEISLGDFVLSGGEIPAMAVIDAVARLVPGVLGHANSASEDSFFSGLLDCPHYTRPELYEGELVPGVLLGGNHKDIARWRLKESLGRTWERRPELIKALVLTEEMKTLLEEYRQDK
ncbi:MAG: tRNA (guanosine(37)-N1)-methyltransferase TrmD [Hahellaceae bacterium]|nr:tRNA (guanosine(37)-N1)-methyltransferase TrmD [Hahellaceae bacterium]MCP5212396.1 tRNA (guanosine(37)-N1)-methyltransferase TrmD [Hahellaceae bacterium]